MSIPKCTLTHKGAALQAKTPAGAQIPVTRWQMGTGILPEDKKLEDMTQLVQPITYRPISSVTNSGRQALVLGQFANEGMEAFDWEELGLWAQDPEEGEILYAVGNARGGGEHIEAWTEKVREFVFGMELVFSGTANVTAEISRTLVFATLKDLDAAVSAHATDPAAHQDIRNEIAESSKLSEDTKTALGLGEDATLDDALAALQENIDAKQIQCASGTFSGTSTSTTLPFLPDYIVLMAEVVPKSSITYNLLRGGRTIILSRGLGFTGTFYIPMMMTDSHTNQNIATLKVTFTTSSLTLETSLKLASSNTNIITSAKYEAIKLNGGLFNE